MNATVEKQPVWKPTQVQFLYRHQNERYYVRTFSGGKEKWTSLQGLRAKMRLDLPVLASWRDG